MHRIRLRQPWDRQPTAQAVRWERRFGRPARLGPHQRVWLIVEGISTPGTAVLNGQVLGPLPGNPKTVRFDATDRLLPRNRLLLTLEIRPEMEHPAEAGVPGNVFLEIQDSVDKNDRPGD